MTLTTADIPVIEQWWVEKARKNFFAYRLFMRGDSFKHNWFVKEFCLKLQRFYKDLVDGKRPILLISTPPQHGKSITVSDFIAWIVGKINTLRVIYASYSDTLGKRCNLSIQRTLDTEKYQRIFPETGISIGNVVNSSSKPKRNSEQIEFTDSFGVLTEGQFRNTTVQGPITGESLDLGVIDDAVKGREQANSPTWSQKTWEWFTDDFNTRFSEFAGLLIIATRWTTHDIIGRLINEMPNAEVINYPALATYDEEYRKEGEPLFPELKSKEFLLARKKMMPKPNWESLYQGSPTVSGGNKFRDSWWKWWKILPSLQYKFITADTSQKTKDENDWCVFQAWGVGVDGDLYLLDKKRNKWEAPDLRRQAEIFYRKHDTKRVEIIDPTLRAMYVEDKSSGTGLLQELRALSLNVVEVPRVTDKNMRADDAAPYVEAGRVHLNTEIDDVDNLCKEAREFPNSEFDDDIDTLMTAIEVTYLNADDDESSLEAAMGA